MEIRRARPGDEVGIGTVHIRSWQTTYPGIVPQEVLENLNLERRIAWWAKIVVRVEELKQSLWVAVDADGTILGFAHGGAPQVEEPGYSSELYAIYLLQQVQGQGTGQELVKRVAQDLCAAGHRTMLVGVLAENAACRFYERLGARLLRELPTEIGGASVLERYYGWPDLSVLLQ